MKKTLLSLFLVSGILSVSAQIQTAGSYLNITRPNGGPIQKGDILEVRAIISVPTGINITACRFTDNVPAGTAYVANSIKTVTNEGVVVAAVSNTGNYTDATGDDRGQYVSGAITVYIGNSATSAAGGSINGASTLPRHFNAACILMIAYRVTVMVYNGSSINLTGAFRYTQAAVVTNVALSANTLRVAPPGGCSSVSGTNVMTSETNGTFGSGTTLSRSSSALVTGFAYQNLAASTPQDGQYSITKSTSPTQYTGATPAMADRVHNAWDIIGDHSGTTNGAGNAPAAAGANRGYMAVVNATFAPAAVFTMPLTGLLTNTSYSFSFWVRNICGTCGNDPTANAGSGTPGVKPNLAFEMDGSDLYSTGDIAYTNQWVLKSFTFYSGASTSMTLTIKNNAPGGGGNDWAIDDIILERCFIVLPVTMTSFTAARNENDVVLKWETEEEKNLSYFGVEKSTDGTTFNGIGTVSGKLNEFGSQYQFTDKNTINGKIYYRLRVVDKDNKITYSKTLHISGNGLLNQLTLVSNPVRNEAIVNVESDVKGLAGIKILSVDGKLMLSQTATVTNGANQIGINGVSNLSNGIYLVYVTIGANKMTTRMIVSN